MKILLLPGASVSNKEWLDSWALALENRGFEVYKMSYDHWDAGGDFNFEKEEKKIAALDNQWKNAFIVAKSMGSLLALYTTYKKILAPAGGVFMGMPSNFHGEKDGSFLVDIKIWLETYTAPTFVFQNEKDPVTSFEQVKQFLAPNPAFTIQSLQGHTHSYPPNACFEEALGFMSKNR